MNTIKLLAILLIAAGALGMGYGGFSYTEATHATNIGPLHLEVTEEKRVNIPLWVGGGVIAAGLLLLFAASGKK